MITITQCKSAKFKLKPQSIGANSVWNQRLGDWEPGETGSADRSGVTARQAGVHPETQGEWETDTE